MLSVGYSVLRQGSEFSSTRSSFTNSNIGVFVGVEPSGLQMKEASVFSASGGALSVTAGRLSFSLGLVGPCYSIDAACASSLAALHACVTTLQNGRECEDGKRKINGQDSHERGKKIPEAPVGGEASGRRVANLASVISAGAFSFLCRWLAFEKGGYE